MSKIPVKGIEMYLQKAAATPLALVPTAISAAKPPVVSVPSVTGLVKGLPVTFAGTNFPELDGQTFVVGEVDSLTNDFEVIGADTTGSTAVIGSTPSATVYELTDMVKLCLSSVEIAAPTVNQVDTSTYCEESTMPGKVTPGQITLGGYLEKGNEALDELILADTDGIERIFIVKMPSDNGYLIGSITLAGLGYTIPLEGAVGFTISGSQTSKIRYVY